MADSGLAAMGRRVARRPPHCGKIRQVANCCKRCPITAVGGAGMLRERKKALITDLDNTLFDWVDVWFKCFDAMLSEISNISGIPADQLKPEIREIHRKHRTSEYSFLIEEMPSWLEKYGTTADLAQIFSGAIEAYRTQRRRHLVLYPTVADTLLKIKGAGARIIAYTESLAFYSNYRVRRLGLDGVLDYIFSPKDHDIPASLSRDAIRRYPASHYQFRYTVNEHTPKESKKPDRAVLEAIISHLKLESCDCVYVGDSLAKDVAMAQDAYVTDVWAKYGQVHGKREYRILRELTHWSDEEIAMDEKAEARDVKPSFVLRNSFSEILGMVEFGDAHVS
jgi:FMN phosphatase YigB (HAD superfamily)